MGLFYLLLIVISMKIVLALVASSPTNWVSLNSESIYRSCVSSGVSCSGTTARGSGITAATSVATSAPDQKLAISPAVVGTDVIF